LTFTVGSRGEEQGARSGTVTVRGRKFATPVFMPVGTAAAVKALTFPHLAEMGAQICLANAYHLYLRPGMEIIRKLGGLHGFTRWPGAYLVDSGGYQVFSMQGVRKITDDGVHFRSYLDGSPHYFDAEKVIEVQLALNPDIAMILDDCTPYPADRQRAQRGVDLTVNWAERAVKYYHAQRRAPETSPVLFGIVQGSIYPDVRRSCTERLLALDFAGYAIGGLSVGEPKENLWEVLETVVPLLPADKPKYLMGVGTPEDLVLAVERGIDMFDCVLPTRNGRNGTAFTSRGVVTAKAARYKQAEEPLDEDCRCFVCRTYSRAYLRHLLNINHMTACTLVSYHNMWFYLQLMESLRRALEQNTFSDYKKDFLAAYRSGDGALPTTGEEA
jgi:queuine tRNA-ribosyltransferase